MPMLATARKAAARRARSVYVASSWRNSTQPLVVKALREAGMEVYDFREGGGFHWGAIDPGWRNWSPEFFVGALDHPVALEGFRRDFEAMQSADVCLMVQPCGVSAALEAGYFAGAGKPVAVLLELDDRFQPELMLGLLDAVHTTLASAVEWARTQVVRHLESD